MTRQQKIAHALSKLKMAQRYVKEAEKELRLATKPERKKEQEHDHTRVDGLCCLAGPRSTASTD